MGSLISVPGAALEKPHIRALHTRVWHAVPCGQSVSVRHSTQFPRPSHTLPLPLVQAVPAASALVVHCVASQNGTVQSSPVAGQSLSSKHSTCPDELLLDCEPPPSPGMFSRSTRAMASQPIPAAKIVSARRENELRPCMGILLGGMCSMISTGIGSFRGAGQNCKWPTPLFTHGALNKHPITCSLLPLAKVKRLVSAFHVAQFMSTQRWSIVTRGELAGGWCLRWTDSSFQHPVLLLLGIADKTSAGAQIPWSAPLSACF